MFSPSKIDGDKVEIDYLRFIPKKAKYANELYGRAHEIMSKELRETLYMNTPLSLTYRISIPRGKSFLKFGMGILEKDDPVTFKVEVKTQESQKEIFCREISRVNKWHDAKIDFSQWADKDAEITFIASSQKGNVAFWSNPLVYASAKEKFNVIIVVEDALRADHLSCYGYPRKTTPVKDEFIKNGVLFLNAFSQATTTSGSVPAIMTSLYPTATGVYKDMLLNDKYLTLAEILRSQGFVTASFAQNDNAGLCTGLHQGFSYLFNAGKIGVRARKMYSEQLYQWIEHNRDRNFFLYLHLLDPHGQYDPPPPFDSWYREAPLDKPLALRDRGQVDPDWVMTPTLEGRRLLYDGEIRYNDFWFGKFLERLKKQGLLENTLIIFIADHGEHLGEHDRWLHRPPAYIQVSHVPMIMVFPEEFPKNKKIIQPVQLIDLMPSILELSGIETNNFLIQGDSLIPLIQEENLDFWNQRLCITDAVRHKKRNDKNAWGAIIYKNWHIINSKHFLNLSYGCQTCFGSEGFLEFALGTRVFNYFQDKEEKYFLNSFFVDMFFKYKIGSFLRKLQKNNTRIWQALTKDTGQTIKYDPEALKRLRDLGYW